MDRDPAVAFLAGFLMADPAGIAMQVFRSQ